ncbi:MULTISPECIES: nucleotidyltransferase substrate binding protein [Cetobacterium]|uniref:nucleotidyltransferase substrate binding protein n=1 Tax=Cetobacterium TaxID=180162 RepID=UPI00163C5E11|nr:MULTISPECIES: nucleotidyltransferase substrate binding protein [Cetobacterium]MBC2854489.1 nucleotidyltransferase substrate binding protein [Cetobacterium sp. 2G large]MCQ9626412.1 nucleotidyltransferase substrate binding protein [Cetobacterium somerae]
MGKRWSEKIKDLENAVSRLDEAIKDSKKIELSTLKDGVIQRFEFTLELSWKILKTYLVNEGIDCVNTPKSVVREAYKAGIIKSGEIWIEMIDDRNLTSHIYSQSMADDIYLRITKKYFKELDLLFHFLKEMNF